MEIQGSDGKRQVTGDPEKLQESQEYPVKFALAVVKGQFPEAAAART